MGKASLEFQKQQAKLNAAFEAAGSNAQQAGKTYKELFRFLGDADRATEAAQSLARITTNTKDLTEWTTILQGIYARTGNAIPVESLAEAANETVKVGQVTGAVADALNWLGVSEDEFNAKLQQTTSLEEREVMLRSTLNALYGEAAGIYERNNQSLIKYNESQYQLDAAMAQASRYIVPLMTELNILSATLLTVFAPAIETVALYLTAFIQLLVEAIQWVGNFFGMFGSETEKTTADVEGYRTAMNNYLNSLEGGFGGVAAGAQKAGREVEKLKRQTMGFDELNVVQAPVSTSAGSVGSTGGTSSGIANLPTPPNPADFGLDTGLDALGDFTEELEIAKEKMKVILTIAGIAAGAFALWKLAGFIQEVSAAIKLVKLASVEGAAFHTLFAGEKAGAYLDKIKGIAGTFLIISGAIAAVVGYSDAWVDGIDWGNFAAVLGGIGAIVAGLTLKFGATAGGVGALVGGIAMLVLGVKDMIENGASLENILMTVAGAITVVTGALMLMGKENIKAVAGWIAHTAATVAQKIATVAMTVAQTALNLVMNMSPIGWIITIIAALVAAFVVLWNKCDGFREFWQNLWEGIKKTFGAAWDGIKNVFSGVASFFSGVWDKIKSIFSGIGKVVGGAISDTVKVAINTVLGLAVRYINGFIGAINLAIKVINAIPGVDIKTINKLSVPKLARGGIVDRATLSVIGEAGKEAVLPLENNTGWMDALADKLAQRNNTPSKIVLMVDKKELGYAAINSINGITQQTGKLQLVY